MLRVFRALFLGVGVWLLISAPSTGAFAEALPDLFSPEVNLVFEHITVDDGLPENSVRAVLQDRHGFMWFGTQLGLVRYDGLALEVFLPDVEDSTSFGGRTVDALHEDHQGNIWIGTMLRGLWRYDAVLGTFHHLPCGRDDMPQGDSFHVTDIAEDDTGRLWLSTENGLATWAPGDEALSWPPLARPVKGNGIPRTHLSVLADDQGRIWCGTEGDGLARFDPVSGRTHWFLSGSVLPGSLPHANVRDLYQAPDGRIWVATDDGLCLWQETSRNFRVYRSESPNETEQNLFICMAQNDQGLMWLGSAAGLLAFYPATGDFRLFQYDPKRATSPVNGPILSVTVDRSGLVWAGSWLTGLNKMNPEANWFLLRQFVMEAGSPAPASVEAVLEDSHGHFYVGTSDTPRGRGRGIVFRRPAGSHSFIPLGEHDPDGQLLPSVLSFHEDTEGTVWLGTWSGLWRVDGAKVVPAGIGEGPAGDQLRQAPIKDLSSDHEGRLWLATSSGAFRWDRRRQELRHFRHDPLDPRSLSSNDQSSLYVDTQGRVWFGGDARGLNLFLGDGQGFQRFFDSESGLETISDFHETTNGDLWLATYSGLLRFDPATGAITQLDRRRGLPNDNVASIQEDDQGRLWLSTGFGLACVDRDRDSVKPFDARDGLPDNRILYAHCRSDDGTLHFGGAWGLISFDPGNYVSSTFQPGVVLTGISLSDQPLGVGGASPLTRLPHLLRRLKLRHDQNDLSLTFASLDYARPRQNGYRFMLEGVDDDWRVPDQEHRATYVKLQPGQYTFRVRGSNRDGLFSDAEAMLAIEIAPPWWGAWWAYLIYGILAILVMIGAYRQLTMRERMRAKLDLQRAESEKLQELDEMKSRFLTNITHEFRTPLTLIKVPLMRLKSEQEGELDDRLSTMLRNTDRLEELIDQLLDLSRLEAGQLPLKWSYGDCMTYLGVFVSSFESLAVQRSIHLTVEVPEEPCLVWYDADLIEKLVGNLLTNAMKHTSDEGQVVVVITAGPVSSLQPPITGASPRNLDPVAARQLVVAVTNTGSYIPSTERDRVFDRFYQVSTATGSGVGLALVKELTEWLGGTVDLASDPDSGTCFTASVPVFLAHPEGKEGIPEAEDALSEKEDESLEEEAEDPADEETKILIVEDNRDLRSFMAKDLAGEFTVLEAADGAAGLKIAIDEVPDLILSDVMMPEMDGFELCRRLKNDERTSHVPVILLTARSEAESRHTGLKSGADDYLAKPFDAEDLVLRIRNLVEQRRKLAEIYERKLSLLPPEAMPVTSSDERFMTQLRKTIDANLSKTDLKTSDLYREVAMSRSQLHRKLKALTGKSATDFVRTHRLQRARQLFDGGYGNVTEVAYAVGFLSLSYFARSFKNQYGVQPSEYLRQIADGISLPTADPDPDED